MHICNGTGRVRRALAGATLAASMLAVPAVRAGAQPALAPRDGGHAQLMPVMGARPPRESAFVNTSGAWEQTPNPAYAGGPLIQHVKVVQVLWGAENPGSGVTYTPQVKGTVTPNLQTFYSQVTNSSYMDWLKEYNAGGQTINRGTFVNKFQIAPAPANDGSQVSTVIKGQTYGVIDDTNIQNELKSQIAASHLPAPDADTLYMLHFPSARAITVGGFNSIQDFCAYHSAYVPASGPHVRYAVVPDTSAAVGQCFGDTPWRNLTALASNQLTGAITDPDGALASSLGQYPAGWFDDNLIPFTPVPWGEVSDICTGVESRVIGADTVVYSVQRAWSSRSQRCVTQRTISVGDASVLEGDAGQRGIRIPITLSDPSTSADVTVQYTVTGGTATGPATQAPGVDFGMPGSVLASGTVTFARVSGQTPVRQTVLAMVYGDTDVESNETFTVTLSSPSNGYTLGRSVATATILDDDATPLPAGKLRAIGIGDSSVSYGSFGVRQLVFPISLSKAIQYPTVIHWTLHDGTAKLGPEYLGGHTGVDPDTTSGVAVIPAGSTGVFLYVDVRASHMATTTKQMTVSLEQVSIYPLPGWMAIARNAGTGTIFVG